MTGETENIFFLLGFQYGSHKVGKNPVVSVKKGRLEQEERNLNFWWKNSKYLSIFCYQSKFIFFWKISPCPIWLCQHSRLRDSADSHMPFGESSYFTYGLDSPENQHCPVIEASASWCLLNPPDRFQIFALLAFSLAGKILLLDQQAIVQLQTWGGGSSGEGGVRVGG